ncbi:IS1634 family transposase [Micromonospora sp. S4605]|uniref:IS1634 family transposase n=1 Tax=Micromonospora sp. S4605 TaxID=1420897 RepID=UPI000D6EE42A|nr:IS1634 family transposase [Micromonospora sp. S4605]PWU50451.1 IS1634 family transposase [Micromonospora sp. S4605]
MYVKTTVRKTKSGQVRYLHLAHNEWDPVAGRSVPKILYGFGREDQLDRDAVKRLVASLARLLDPADALAATAGSQLQFLESRPWGGTFTLDALWRRLGIDTVLRGLDTTPRRGRPRDTDVTERVLFGLVANRALAPSSKLAAADWINHDVHIDGLPETSDDACYRAMDWLHDVRERLEIGVFGQVANLLNLEVDLLFFDTTSTYFELADPDTPVGRDERGHRLPTDGDGDEGEEDGEATNAGFRTYGKSKDSRDDLPQIVIGMAVTRDGIPVRVWCWPGNTADSKLIRQVKDDMRDWTLSKIVWVADRGFSSERNRRYLRQGDHSYIIGEKLRSDSPEIKAALSRQGRYTEVAQNMRVKEVKVSETERFVICHNPDAATRDAHIRDQLVAQLDELIAGSDTLPVMKRGELRGRISTKPGLNRYLRVTPGGLLRIDKAKCKTEANLDGKYLLRCSDPHLTAADIALGYKQLLEVERGWRDMKQILDLRPVYHRLEERIRAHVVLCWLALLLIRIAETTIGDTWHNIRRHLDRLHAGTFTGPNGLFRQRTELSKPQRDLLAKLDIPAPKQIIELAPASR